MQDKSYTYHPERLTECEPWQIQFLASLLENHVANSQEGLVRSHSGVDQLLYQSQIAYAEELLSKLRTETAEEPVYSPEA